MPPPDAKPESRPSSFRHDVHGVRGLALALVVAFHVLGDGRVSGGIDVFLALTGYLATTSLLRHARQGRVDVAGHVRRLAARLLPPLLLTTTAVAVAVVLLLPEGRWPQVARELRASVLYVENWELIRSQLGYEAAGPGSSPLQHIWSMSVQGQFHVLWLVAAAVTVAAAHALGRRPAVLLGVVAGMLTVGSFAYAVHLTAQDQPVAYLHTGTRLWQPALGALAAVLLPRLRLPGPAAALVAWTGLGMIASTGFWLDGAALFPGPAALWPVGGLLLVLLGGGSGHPWGPERALRAAPVRFVADVSYALYLWHWPVLVLLVEVRGLERAGPTEVVTVLGVSLALAWLTTRAVRGGRRLAPRRHGLRVVAGATAVVAVVAPTVVATTWVEDRERAALDALVSAEVGRPGAVAMAAGSPLGDEPLDPATVVPELAVVRRDLPLIYRRDCIQGWADVPAYDAVLVCDDPDAPREPTARLVMTGGSHVIQWWPAFRGIADRLGWELVVVEKDGCHLTAERTGRPGSPRETSCDRWNREAVDVIAGLEPDVVVTLGTTTSPPRERTPDGFVDVWRTLGDRDVPVLALRDTPRFDSGPPSCLEQTLDAAACGRPPGEVLAAEFPLVEAPPSVRWVDMTPYFCTDDLCPAVIGDVVVYRDATHLSATYVRTLEPFLERQLREVAPELFLTPPRP